MRLTKRAADVTENRVAEGEMEEDRPHRPKGHLPCC